MLMQELNQGTESSEIPWRSTGCLPICGVISTDNTSDDTYKWPSYRERL